MDFNVKVIESVRQCPALYGNNYTLEERSQAWLMLADKLKTNEQVLKVRWHYLLQRYQQEANFRYASRMNFLQDSISTWHVKIHHWPEFLITEEDLRNESPGEKAEFQYLIEGQEEKNECKITKQKDDDKNYTLKQNKKNIGLRQISNATAKNRNDEQESNAESCTQKCAPLEFQNKLQPQEYKNEEDCAESPTNITNKIDDMSVEKAIVNQTPDKACSNMELESVPQNTIVELIVEPSRENSEAPKEKLKSSCNERCEDDIFGELVSAMLKRMDESKKKNIKKEIMNILFS